MSLGTKTAGRWFFALVRRRPTVFASVALTGLIVGVFLTTYVGPARWAVVGIGILCVIFYAALLEVVS